MHCARCLQFDAIRPKALCAVQLINVDPDRFEDADGDEPMQGPHASGR